MYKNLYAEVISDFLNGYERFYYSLKKFKLNSIIYKTGMCLPFDFQKDELIVGKIILILCENYTILFFFVIYILLVPLTKISYRIMAGYSIESL